MTAPKNSERPKQPAGLGAPGKALWGAVVDAYELRPDEIRVLEGACRTADLIVQLERALKGEPLTVLGVGGQLRSHPLIVEIRQQRIVFASLLKQLRLPDEPSEARSTKTAANRSSIARAAAHHRWHKDRSGMPGSRT